MIGRPPAHWIRECLPLYCDEVLTIKDVVALTGKNKRTVAHSMTKYFGPAGYYGPESRFQARWLVTFEGLKKAGYTGPDFSDPVMKELKETLMQYKQIKV